VYRVCRTLPSFDCLSGRQLVDAIDYSVDSYLPMLRSFDEGLPIHLHRKSQATWLEFTCVDVHVCNAMTGSYLNIQQTASVMQHIDLLYRVYEFMETLVETHGTHNTSAVL
jgi:hypothetical protein